MQPLYSSEKSFRNFATIILRKGFLEWSSLIEFNVATYFLADENLNYFYLPRASTRLIFCYIMNLADVAKPNFKTFHSVFNQAYLKYFTAFPGKSIYGYLKHFFIHFI